MTALHRRQLWMMVHRYVGLGVLLFLIIATVTGLLLCFAQTLDARLNYDLFENHGPSMDPIVAVRHLSARRPDLTILSFATRATPDTTVLVRVAARAGAVALGYDQVFVDMPDGHIRGVRQTGPGFDRRHFVDGIFAFHTTLLAGTVGRWVMGLAALGWFVGNLVGAMIRTRTVGAGS